MFKKLLLITFLVSSSFTVFNGYYQTTRIEIDNINDTCSLSFESSPKLYDLVMGSGLLKSVIDAIPADEYNDVMCGIEDSIDAVYSYQNSVLGILDAMKTDYDNLNFDASAIQEKLADPQNMELLKGILSELG